MSTIKYIGRKTDFRGKSLWEIVGNLKNFGVGRIVVRSMFERYPEPSYMKIVKVQAVPSEQNRKVKVTVERTFRGQTYPNLIEMYSTSYKTDYRLIPKDEEPAYCRAVAPPAPKILPATMDPPPLLKYFMSQDIGNLDPRLNIVLKKNKTKFTKIAQDGMTPTINIAPQLPKSELYKEIN